MFSISPLALLSLLTAFVSPLTLQPFQNQSTTNSALKLRSKTLRCDGNLYGRSLDLLSCTEAFSQLPWKYDKREMTFGARGTGIWDVTMPYRVLSCTFVANKILVWI